MRTRSPCSMESLCSSIVAVPYSSSYSSETVSHGSLPSLRIGTKPALKWYATGAARMNPRASIPTTLSTVPRPKWTTIRSMIVDIASACARIGVMSLKTMPGSGKSGTSLISALICSISTTSPPLALGRRLAPLRLLSGSPGRRGPDGRAGGGRLAGARAGRRRGRGRRPSRYHPFAVRQLLLELPESRLPLLQDREERRGEEDRRVHADRGADEHREREVLERLATEEQQGQDREQNDEGRVHRSHQHLVEGEVDRPVRPQSPHQ